MHSILGLGHDVSGEVRLVGILAKGRIFVAVDGGVKAFVR